MSFQPSRLPKRLPAGTKYVIEGRGGRDGRLRVHSRYLELPDGRQLELPANLAERVGSRAGRPATRRHRAAPVGKIAARSEPRDR
jgi:hypothetical protein